MSAPTVSPVDRGPAAVSRTVTVDVPAGEIFARLADPRRHHELDGSGTVGEGISGPERLSRDARFSVHMRLFRIPYRITSVVTRFDEGRDIAWRHPMGHTWRWELEPAGEGRTRVTETWDTSTGGPRAFYRLTGTRRRNVAGIEATLRGLPARLSRRS
jgi:hypothetical protein